MKIFVSEKDFNRKIEIVERKGLGHPDTLSDNLAETLSKNYSNFTKDKFEAILHHNFDKVGLLGGSSFVSFGKGFLINPVRVLINGRVSTKFAQEKIPVRKLLTRWTKEFFRKNLPLMDVEEDLEFHLNLSSQSSPGKVYEKESKRSARRKWFEPESLNDLPELKNLASNDTSLGVGYAPVTVLEQIAIESEETLNSKEYKKRNPWIGSDIKVMAFREGKKYFFTMCIPQIANLVKSLSEYKKNLVEARETIENIFLKHGVSEFELSINTRDNYELMELYLTAIGSSIESGDEGLSGRGNRVNKLISPTRPMSMEGSFGKNPLYHVGKVYYVAAFDIANKIYDRFNIECEVYLISQSGRKLLDPWIVAINVPPKFENKYQLENFVRKQIEHIKTVTGKILHGLLIEG